MVVDEREGKKKKETWKLAFASIPYPMHSQEVFLRIAILVPYPAWHARMPDTSSKLITLFISDVDMITFTMTSYITGSAHVSINSREVLIAG